MIRWVRNFIVVGKIYLLHKDSGGFVWYDDLCMNSKTSIGLCFLIVALHGSMMQNKTMRYEKDEMM